MERNISLFEVVNPLLFSASQAENLRKAFETDPKSSPRDVNSLFGKGLVYLALQNYELASLNFKTAVDLTPSDPDVYYYYALSLLLIVHLCFCPILRLNA